MKKIKKQLNKSAFSLIEIIVVLFIISIGLIGILSLIVQNIQAQDYNKNNLIATQLSQEGVELIRVIRDSNWLKGNDFHFGLAETAGIIYSYCFAHNDESLLPSEDPCMLNLNEDGFYVHESTAVSSGFSRLITAELIEEGSAIRVISTVSWSSRVGQSSYSTEALLYNWR